MPVYEFQCTDCDHTFSEFFRRISSAKEGASPPCPRCASTATVRRISSFSIGGPTGPDAQGIAAENAHQSKLASITPKEQIDKWHSAKQ